jgi:hypothetical protein
MRQINDHMKDVVGIEPVQKPEQPKPSPNPLKWNWTAIIAWAVIGIVVYNLVTFIFS